MTTTRPGTRRGARWLVVAFLVALALLAGAAPASAHASLLSTDPTEGEVLEQAPDVVTFTFDEAVDLTSDSVQVFDAQGEPVESSASTRDAVVTADLPGGLGDGTYVIAWRVVSADGHPISGSLTFSVGAPSETVVPPPVDETAASAKGDLGIANAAQYVGLLVAGGLVVFGCWLVGPAGVPTNARPRLRRFLWWSAALAVLAALVGVPLAGAYQQGVGLGGILSSEVLDLSLVGDDVLVLGLQVVGLAVALLATRHAHLSDRRRLLATAAVAVAVLSPALVGHTRAYEPVWLLVATDVIHLGAGAVWLGGLVGLALTLPALAGREIEAAVVVSRFSTVAATALALLVATGSLLAWRILGSWSALVDTRYGTVLLFKIAVAVVVVALAGYNRFRLVPRVRSAVGHDDRRRAVLGVRDTVVVEGALLLALLAVTGLLVNQAPRDEEDTAAAAAPSRVASGTLDDVKVLATLSPGARGRNTLQVQVQDPTGEPVDGFATPEVSVRSEDVDLGLVPLVPTAAGTYAADVVFPSAGTWEVQVSLRVSEFDNPVTTLTVDVS